MGFTIICGGVLLCVYSAFYLCKAFYFYKVDKKESLRHAVGSVLLIGVAFLLFNAEPKPVDEETMWWVYGFLK